MSFSFDGATVTGSTSSAASSASGSLTTTFADDVVVMLVHLCSPTTLLSVSSISGGGLTWTRRSQLQWTDTSGDTIRQTIEVWWARAPTTLTAQTVTITYSASASASSFQMFNVRGCGDPSAPWDAAGPVFNHNATNTSNSLTVSGASTVSASTVGFLFYGATPIFPTSASSFTVLTTTGSFPSAHTYTQTQYKTFTSPQASFTAAAGGGLYSDWGLIFDALAGPTQATLAVTLDDATLSATGGGRTTGSLAVTLDNATLDATGSVASATSESSGAALLMGL